MSAAQAVRDTNATMVRNIVGWSLCGIAVCLGAVAGGWLYDSEGAGGYALGTLVGITSFYFVWMAIFCLWPDDYSKPSVG